MCANLLRLEDDLKALEAAGCQELHFDIMDGMFVPNITLGFDFIKAAKRCCNLPCSAHLMINTTDKYIDRFVEAGCDSITVHIESCTHIQRTLSAIREAGCSPGVAVNPATPLTKLDFVLDYADRVLLMTVDPGYAGQTIIPGAFDRVNIMKQNIDYRKLNTRIEADGNIDVKNAAMLANQGAQVFVLGTSSIFNSDGTPKGTDLETAFQEFSSAVSKAREVL
jgi:ribulose-phosphate 3-epimerase